MKAFPALGAFLGLSILSVVFAIFSATHSHGEPIPLPDWVKPIEGALPKIPPEIIAEVDDIFWFNAMHSENLHIQDTRTKIQSNNLRIVELRELAGQAMIWQYFKRSGRGHPPILLLLEKDRELAALLLPILRFRIELYQQAIAEDRLKEFLKAQTDNEVGEIHEIQRYLIHQGEFSDLENLNDVYDGLFKFGYSYSESSRELQLQAQLEAIQKVRKLGQQQDQPYWKSVAQELIAEGLLSEDVLRVSSASKTTVGGDHPKPLGPRKPLSSDPTPSQSQQTWKWIIWTLSGLVSLGLLRWVLKKFNKA